MEIRRLRKNKKSDFNDKPKTAVKEEEPVIRINDESVSATSFPGDSKFDMILRRFDQLEEEMREIK
jgi:hypothetical protein